MTLNEMLLKIREGVPINFKHLTTKLPTSYKWNRVFNPQLVSNNKYLVEVLDRDLFEQLLVDSVLPENRAQAARHVIKSSHSVKCDTAFKLIYPNGHIFESAQPQVITCTDEQSNFECFTLTSQAILIENQDCFFQYPAFLKRFENQLNTNKYDIIFSAGKQILDKRFTDFLSNYQQISCLFDYDLAGLSIFHSLKLSVNQNSEYLLPDSLSQSACLFTMKPNNTRDLLSAIKLSTALGLEGLASIFETKKCFMEQEALLKCKKL